ncbi:hypothetical protein ACFOW1_01780 [Parasediminibacterium paludis]|uniref:Uncharacterized protein n=1 Tax=Parasediminibacterium paludis TaxID=908966 RepID=A0ABV8PUN4_9BACT
MADVTHILKEDALQDAQLINYLVGNLSDEERHAIELQMLEDDFANDAIEGLENVSNKAQLDTYVKQLNQQLQKQIATKKQRKAKRKLADNQWLVISICVVLAICLLGYYMLHLKGLI